VQPSLIPFDESEHEIIKSGLQILATVNFFERLAKDESLKAVNNFDSLQVAEQVTAIQRLGGTRSILLLLDQDSKAIMKAAQMVESEAADTGDSNAEESLLTLLEPE